MKVLKSNFIKVIILVIISVLIFSVWNKGVENTFTKTLVGITNVVLKVVKERTYIEIENVGGIKETYQFKIYSLFDGQVGSFPQEIKSLLDPFVIILSWQIFLFFALPWKKALSSFWKNILIFMSLQVIFLIFLTGYYTSETQKFMYELMKDSFYIVALILVIKDNMLYPIFRNPK